MSGILSSNNLPIGVFDSGIGGLIVLKSLALAFPQENFLYVGDTARLPYGPKSPETIRRYSEQIMNYLVRQGVKAIVIACNSASSQVTELQWKGIPVYNVITPGALMAVKVTQNNQVGVLGTRATIQSHSYPRAIHNLNPEIQVHSQACPLFVPLAEEGWIDDPITNLIVYRYLHSLTQIGVDTVILACTHYPLLKSSIRKVFGSSVHLVDSGEAVSQVLVEDIKNSRVLPTTGAKSKIQICCTDLSSQFERMVVAILTPLIFEELKISSMTL